MTNKKVLWLISLIILVIINQTNAQKKENMEGTLGQIRETVDGYFIGTTDGKIDELKASFHPDCKIYSIDESGKLTYLTQEQFYQVVLDNYEKFKRKNQILSIDVAGNTAAVKTRADYPSFAFVDFLTLLKIEGHWKIVSKSTFRIDK